MTTFPGSPRLLKGAIIGIDAFNPLASTIVFQYNPKEIDRVITATTGGGKGGDKKEALRLTGAPKETITLNKVEINAFDQLEKGDPIATSMGIYPQLSALEMLLYPKSLAVLANNTMIQAGMIEIAPVEAPLTLLVWGARRVVPVQLSTFTIKEKEYDVNLNPICAELSLNFTVLSYNDLPISHIGNTLFLAHQVAKEAMATISSAGAMGSVVSGATKIL